jgi:hypothetical protein
MSYTTEHKQKFYALRHHIENQDQLRRQANGGNSILFSYPPNEEHLYIEEARARYSEAAEFIDVSRLFVKFIDEHGWEAFKSYYCDDFQYSTHLLFKSDDPETDLFDMIITHIETACKKDKIPFLIRTGVLYGTGIENVNIMEHRTVMNLPRPLVIFYPASLGPDDTLLFLNFKPASRYRCTLVK